MSLWPFSSSTSNIALGSAWETVASMTTACSFWSPFSRSALRAFGVRVPRRGPLFFPKSRESLLGLSGEHGAQRLRLRRRHALRLDEPVDEHVPAAVEGDGLRHELRALRDLARLGQRDAGPEAKLDVVRRNPERLDALRLGGRRVARLVEM